MKVNFKEMTFDEVAISYKLGDEPLDYTRGMDIPDQVSDY
jgi:hypothetical protein